MNKEQSQILETLEEKISDFNNKLDEITLSEQRLFLDNNAPVEDKK